MKPRPTAATASRASARVAGVRGEHARVGFADGTRGGGVA